MLAYVIVLQVTKTRSKWIRRSPQLLHALAIENGAGETRFYYVHYAHLALPGTYCLLLCKGRAIGFWREADVRFVVLTCRAMTGIWIPYRYIPPREEKTV
ncbi:MAG: hypothetical protein Q8R39_03950 [bacterium]|nr:hypothetical protein [bacterium]MDZ4284230.1 hypothetical protein [Patescibacteria group bacterium]